ncbi:MAG: hypothetical protein WCD70_03580 [Alphaproteobacteria bacterium]
MRRDTKELLGLFALSAVAIGGLLYCATPAQMSQRDIDAFDRQPLEKRITAVINGQAVLLCTNSVTGDPYPVITFNRDDLRSKSPQSGCAIVPLP